MYVGMSSMPDYSKPTVEEYGSVESLTEDSDKIGTQEDAVNEPGLDGSIVPDQ
jgi:hypothetical protein